MLAWVLHNYWLHCEYAGDRTRMRDGLFPLLRQTVNGYRNYLKDNPVVSTDGTLHIRQSWSPEYPGGHGQDINFTIGLLRWSCETLLALNTEHGLNDPLAVEWQKILDTLVDYQIDENGLRIGKDIPFAKPHRHYSHLLPFFPLALITPKSPEDATLLRTSLDHWLNVSIYGVKKDQAMAVTGYTATGAASMYAWLGDAEKAYHYLDFLINHKNVSSTTMYAEGNPVIETPLSFASSVHEMVLQSWGGRIRVFTGTPADWGDVAFHHFRTQGAFLVSAKKKAGVTTFVSVESLAGSPCVVKTDIESPKIYIEGKPANRSHVQKMARGFYKISLKNGETVILTPVDLEETDLTVNAIPVSEANRHLFGLNDKTIRLAGHQFYHPERGVAFPATKGRFIRIELPGDDRTLSLAEVEVFEKGRNAALNQKTRSSSSAYGGVPERAVDGNPDGDFSNGSVTHTDENSTNPWWEVDLGRTARIDRIMIHNRAGNGTRLDGFTLRILDEQRKTVFVKNDTKASTVIQFGK